MALSQRGGDGMTTTARKLGINRIQSAFEHVQRNRRLAPNQRVDTLELCQADKHKHGLRSSQHSERLVVVYARSALLGRPA